MEILRKINRDAERWLLLVFYVMLVIGLSLVSFVIAGYGTGHEVALWPTDTPLAGRVGFAGVFAVFFPVVTGITAGISIL